MSEAPKTEEEMQKRIINERIQAAAEFLNLRLFPPNVVHAQFTFRYDDGQQLTVEVRPT